MKTVLMISSGFALVTGIIVTAIEKLTPALCPVFEAIGKTCG